MSTYQINVARERPSMSQDVYDFEGTYAEAVAESHKHWGRTRRRVSLTVGSYWYHKISKDGTAIDRNTNSGIPEVAQLGKGR